MARGEDSSRSGVYIKWNEDLRLLLHLIKTDFNLTPSEEVKVFERISGHVGISRPLLAAQYNLRSSPRGRHFWSFLDTQTTAHLRRIKVTTAQIKHACGQLSIREQPSMPPRSSRPVTATGPRRRVLQAVMIRRRPDESSFVPRSPTALARPTWPEPVSLPAGSILYRYNVAGKSQTLLAPDGYLVAGRFRETFDSLEVPSSPPSENDISFWHDVCLHFNRRPTSTPLISTSTSLSWILGLAIKSSIKGDQNGSISLIFVNDSMTLYHARSFHAKLLPFNCYIEGNWRGNHNSEWVVYGKVKTAVTLPVAYILTEAAKHQTVGRFLQQTTLLGGGIDEGPPRSPSKKTSIEMNQYLVDQVYACFMRAVLAQTVDTFMID